MAYGVATANTSRTPYSATAGTQPGYQPPAAQGPTNPYGYGYAATRGATTPQPNTGGGMPTNYGPATRAPGPAPAPQQTSATQGSQGASPYSAGYQPLQYQAGGDQNAFIAQQQAAFGEWLKTPDGIAWQQAQPQGSQWFGQTFNPAPAPRVAPPLVYLPDRSGQGQPFYGPNGTQAAWGGSANTGHFNYGYPSQPAPGRY